MICAGSRVWLRARGVSAHADIECGGRCYECEERAGGHFSVFRTVLISYPSDFCVMPEGGAGGSYWDASPPMEAPVLRTQRDTVTPLPCSWRGRHGKE